MKSRGWRVSIAAACKMLRIGRGRAVAGDLIGEFENSSRNPRARSRGYENLREFPSQPRRRVNFDDFENFLNPGRLYDPCGLNRRPKTRPNSAFSLENSGLI